MHWYVTVTHKFRISFSHINLYSHYPNDISIPYPVVMVMFVQTQVFVNEGDSSRACVSITGQLERPVTITVSISGGSATGSDHDFPSPTVLTFSSSPFIKCIFFNVIQDGIYESDETLFIRLDSFDPQVKTGVDAVYRIRDDDDGMYLINFE